MAALGLQRFCSKKWHLVRVVIVVITMLNWRFCTVYTRPLRSTLLVSRVTALRHTVNSMIRAAPRAFEVFSFFAIITIAYSLIGVSLFHGVYVWPSNNSTTGTDYIIEFTGAFDTFGQAGIAM